MTTVRVEKRKWDGTVSAVDTAHPLAVPGDCSAWLVLAGSQGSALRSGAIEVVGSDELWVAVPGEWWVLCGHTDAARSLNGYKVHAAAPFEAPSSDDEIVWVDLDLDFEVIGDEVALEDEAQFHEHARTMGYPDRGRAGCLVGHLHDRRAVHQRRLAVRRVDAGVAGRRISEPPRPSSLCAAKRRQHSSSRVHVCCVPVVTVTPLRRHYDRNTGLAGPADQSGPTCRYPARGAGLRPIR